MKSIRYMLALVAVSVMVATQIPAQVMTPMLDFPNPGWLRVQEYKVPTSSFVLNVSPAVLTAKEAWCLVGMQTKINLGAGLYTNTWTVTYLPTNLEYDTASAPMNATSAGLATYTLGTLGADVSGSETIKTFTNYPPIRAGDILTLSGSGGTTAATNTTVILWFYRVMPYRNNYGLPQT